MCIATAAAIASVAGSGISAIGAITSGQANAAEANFQAQVAKNNAVTANQNAAYAIKAGEQDAVTVGLKGRAGAGALKTAVAANGIDVNTGSAAQLEEGQARAAQLDTETTRQKAALLAYGYRTQGVNFTAESALQKAKAGFDTTAGFTSAAGSLLSGASAFGGKFGNLLSPSVPNFTGTIEDATLAQ